MEVEGACFVVLKVPKIEVKNSAAVFLIRKHDPDTAGVVW